MSLHFPLNRTSVWIWKLGCLALLLSPGFAPAQKQAQQPEPAPGAAKSCIWKVRGEKATVYLAGSIHLLRASDHPISPDYSAVYQDSQKLYFEIDPADMNSLAAQTKMMQMSMLPDGKTIKDVVSQETLDKVNAYLDKRALGPVGQGLLSMKPGMLSITISSLEMLQLGAQPQFGVETGIDAQGRKDKKPIAGLETVEFQLGMFDKLPAQQQEAFLVMTLDQVEETPKMLDALIECWKTGNDVKLGAMLDEDFKGHEDLRKVMLHDRNETWIPVIEQELKSTTGNSMFVVGAGHLIGEKSVVDLLRKKGYTVERYLAP